MKREYGKDGNNGTDGKPPEILPSVPLFPSFPYSLFFSLSPYRLR
jgi:hypothetical protein